MHPQSGAHYERPLWIHVTGQREYMCFIWVETFHKDFQTVKEVLVEIAEASSRTSFMNEYRVTPESLRTAFAIGFTANDVFSKLAHWSKIALPNSLLDVINDTFANFGRAELVLEARVSDKTLKHRYNHPSSSNDPSADDGPAVTVNRYFIEAPTLLDLDAVLSKLPEEVLNSVPNARKEHVPSPDGSTGGRWRFELARVLPNQVTNEEGKTVEIVPTLSALKDGSIMRAQYAYRTADCTPAAVKTSGIFQRRKALRLRDYQQRAVAQVFRQGHARSGIIVLPCGAGKTPTGVSIACEIGQATLVVVPDAVTRAQWRNQFLACTELKSEDVAFLGDDQYSQLDSNPKAPVIIATYQKLITASTSDGVQATLTREEKQILGCRTFGLLILDECHNLAADKYRTVLDKIAAAHCVIGLTATPVREDGRMGYVMQIIGPRLYEANWLHLVQNHYLAAVQCVEIHCPLPRLFHRERRRLKGAVSDPKTFESAMLALNPTKLWVLQTLVRFHEARGDKILVFVESPGIAWLLGRWVLRCPYVSGMKQVSEPERHGVINHFKYHPDVRTLVATKVLDCGVDVPDANVVIQVQFFGKSRTQEAQRLGRILRPKPRIAGVLCNAFFYVLVVPDTSEQESAASRQSFLQENSFEYMRFDASRILQQRLPGLVCTRDVEMERLMKWIDDFVTTKKLRQEDANVCVFTGVRDNSVKSSATAQPRLRVDATSRRAMKRADEIQAATADRKRFIQGKIRK